MKRGRRVKPNLVLSGIGLSLFAALLGVMTIMGIKMGYGVQAVGTMGVNALMLWFLAVMRFPERRKRAEPALVVGDASPDQGAHTSERMEAD